MSRFKWRILRLWQSSRNMPARRLYFQIIQESINRWRPQGLGRGGAFERFLLEKTCFSREILWACHIWPDCYTKQFPRPKAAILPGVCIVAGNLLFFFFWGGDLRHLKRVRDQQDTPSPLFPLPNLHYRKCVVNQERGSWCRQSKSWGKQISFRNPVFWGGEIRGTVDLSGASLRQA